jgi:hypothetical protein
MNPRLHELQNVPEFQEIDVLPRLERVPDEKWNDDLPKVLPASYPIGHPIAVVLANHAASEKALQGMKHLHVSLMLHHGEFRQNLKSRGHFRMGIDPHMEAAFAIDESHYPLCVKLQWNTLEREVSEDSRIC